MKDADPGHSVPVYSISLDYHARYWLCLHGEPDLSLRSASAL
jgi:hypothetical protein